MHTLNDEIGYGKEWSPLQIDLQLVSTTLKEVALDATMFKTQKLQTAFQRKYWALQTTYSRI